MSIPAISRYPVPTLDALPDDIRARIHHDAVMDKDAA